MSINSSGILNFLPKKFPYFIFRETHTWKFSIETKRSLSYTFNNIARKNYPRESNSSARQIETFSEKRLMINGILRRLIRRRRTNLDLHDFIVFTSRPRLRRRWLSGGGGGGGIRRCDVSIGGRTLRHRRYRARSRRSRRRRRSF